MFKRTMQRHIYDGGVRQEHQSLTKKSDSSDLQRIQTQFVGRFSEGFAPNILNFMGADM